MDSIKKARNLGKHLLHFTEEKIDTSRQGAMDTSRNATFKNSLQNLEPSEGENVDPGLAYAL